MEMVPAHVVPAANPDGLTETVKLVFDGPAVKLPVGDRGSEVLGERVGSGGGGIVQVEAWAVTVRVWEAGATPPATAVKVSAEELNVRPDAVGAVTFRVTVAVCVPPAVIMEIVPVQVVPAVNPD